MKEFEAVIFDMDGLLLDSEKLALAAFKKTCTQFSLGDLSHVFKQLIGTNPTLGDSILESALKGMMDHREFGSAWQSKYAALTNEKPVPLKAGALALLEHIKSLGIPMAVATSTKSDSAKLKLGDSGILNYFDVIIGGEQVSNSKPAPEAYLKAA